MKKLTFLGITLLTSIMSFAQVVVTTKSLDLEPLNKHKNWFIRGAGVEQKTGKTYINFVQGQCDVSSTSDASFVYTTYHGVKYKIDKLIFDENLNYVETINKNYESTQDALLNNELIFYKKYSIPNDPYFPFQIDNSFMFKTVVTYGYAAGKDVVSSFIGLKTQGSSKSGLDYCSDYIKRYEENGTANRQSKGEKWYPVYSNPVPNGGNLLYSTSGVNKEEKQHYVFRKFDKDLNMTKEQTFTFDYNCIITAKAIEKAPGIFDYVFVSMPIKIKSKLKKSAADNYEYFYIDGESYEIKEHVIFKAPKTKWVIDKVIHENSATYIIGGCGENNTDYSDLGPQNESDYENLQVAKFEAGKLSYINFTSNQDLKLALKTSEEFKSNSKISLKMTGTTFNLVNNKLVYQGRQYKGGVTNYLGQSLAGATYIGLQAFVINEEGKVDAILSKEGEDMGLSLVSFSKDGKKLIWFLHDLGEYNKVKDGVMYGSKSKFLLTSLSVLSYDFDLKKIAQYQNLENQEWGISMSNPVLMEDENNILMLGHKITKKAKDSEVVFIKIKK